MASKRTQNTQMSQGEGSSQAPKGSKSKARESEMSLNDVEKWISDIVFFILVQNQKKIPFKRAEIFKGVGLNGQPREVQERIFQDAKHKLLHTFGLEMMELPNEANTYFLINKMESDNLDSDHIYCSDEEKARRGLLVTLLSSIFMSGGVLKEDKLVSLLIKLGLHGNVSGEKMTELREFFVSGGNVKQYIDKELTARQRYFEIRKVDSGDPENPTIEYRWGVRANIEFRKSEILKWIGKLYKCKPEAFTDQMEEVRRLEPNVVFDEAEPMVVEEESESESESE